MKTLGVAATGTAMLGALARLGGLPLLVVGSLVTALGMVAIFFLYRLIRRAVEAPNDGPASRLERLLRVILGRPEPGPTD